MKTDVTHELFEKGVGKWEDTERARPSLWEPTVGGAGSNIADPHWLRGEIFVKRL